MSPAANRLNHIDFYRWDGKDLALVKRVSTGKTPSHLWIDSKSTRVYATMQDSDELVAIDIATQTIVWRMGTGKIPADVFGTPDDRLILVALTGGDSVEVFDVSGAQPVLQKKSRPGRVPTPSAVLGTSAMCMSATAWPTPSARSTPRP